MTKVTGTKVFLDSSAWLGYFLGNIFQTKTVIDSDKTIIFTSIISLHEIYKRLKKLDKTDQEIKNVISFMENNSVIVNISKETAISAANNCEKYGLHTVDSLIYSSAMSLNLDFLTADNDFRNLQSVKILPLNDKKDFSLIDKAFGSAKHAKSFKRDHKDRMF